MKTIALIVFPNQEIFAVEGLLEPCQPMHSNYPNKENIVGGRWYEEWRKYHEDLKMAVKCDQEIAIKILFEQHPNRPIILYRRVHYDVEGVTLKELQGEK